MRPRLATGLPFSPWTSGLGRLSVFAGCELDRTCVHESVGKIQVVQIRRVLLLFALVLGLSALVASIAPPPETEDEEAQDTSALEQAAPGGPAVGPTSVSLSVPNAGGRAPTRRVSVGSSFTLEVSVPEPGDVVLEGLGLRQSADPLAPARFDLVARPPGRYEVAFLPVGGERRVAGSVAFAEPATVTRRRRDR